MEVVWLVEEAVNMTVSYFCNVAKTWQYSFKNTCKILVVLPTSVTVIKFHVRFFLIIFREVSCHACFLKSN